MKKTTTPTATTAATTATHLLEGVQGILNGVAYLRICDGALDSFGGSRTNARARLRHLLGQQVPRFAKLGFHLRGHRAEQAGA